MNLLEKAKLSVYTSERFGALEISAVCSGTQRVHVGFADTGVLTGISRRRFALSDRLGSGWMSETTEDSVVASFHGREIALVLLSALAAFVLLAVLSYSPDDPSFSVRTPSEGASNWLGLTGAWVADVALLTLGRVAYLLPVLLMLTGVRLLLIGRDEASSWVTVTLRTLAWITLVLSCCVLVDLHWRGEVMTPAGDGGVLGTALSAQAVGVLGHLGATLVALTLFLTSLQAALGFSWLTVAEKIGRALHFSAAHLALVVSALVAAIGRRRDAWADAAERRKLARVEAEETARRAPAMIDRTPHPAVAEPAVTRVEAEPAVARAPVVIEKPVKPKADSSARQRRLLSTHTAGELPDLDLLDEDDNKGDTGFSKEELDNLARLVETRLADFNIEVEVVTVLPGPVVTRFEVQPAPGVKVQRISSLVKDLARALAVVSVRIVEVIPGKSVVGIEIPNEKREIVRLKEQLESKAFQSSKSPVTLALGKDIAGESVVADIARMPHLLVAGTTGSGKSVGVNAMILSILYKATPEEVRLILIDPKMLELSIYEGIPHLLTPVVTDMKDAAQSLNWCVAEMERRYKLMAALGVRNLAGFNKQVDDAIKAGTPLRDPLYSGDDPDQAQELGRLPLIVVVIDEFADMMMIVGKKVEQLIARIAQKARAAGVHLVLATQRPSVDVITGLIKANIPTRMAFQVSSKIDSRTILDQGGAEQLLGHGDMLFLPPGTGLPRRVHGAFVDDDEVHRVVADWQARGEPDYLEEVLDGGGEDAFVAIEGTSSDRSGDDENDPLYDEAVAFVLESRRASISAVQRKLRIGYNRAARLIEAMEGAGLVTPMGTNGSREVVVPRRD